MGIAKISERRVYSFIQCYYSIGLYTVAKIDRRARHCGKTQTLAMKPIHEFRGVTSSFRDSLHILTTFFQSNYARYDFRYSTDF